MFHSARADGGWPRLLPGVSLKGIRPVSPRSVSESMSETLNRCAAVDRAVAYERAIQDRPRHKELAAKQSCSTGGGTTWSGSSARDRAALGHDHGAQVLEVDCRAQLDLRARNALSLFLMPSRAFLDASAQAAQEPGVATGGRRRSRPREHRPRCPGAHGHHTGAHT